MDGSDHDNLATAIHPRTAQRSVGESVYVLRVVAGPDAGASVVLAPSQPSPLLVGQGPSCELRLTDRHASRRHLALEVTGGALRLRDLGSTNGTTVQGVRVLEALLRGGERIDLGATTLEVQRQQQAAAQLPLREAFGKLVGASEAMRRLYPLCERLAAAQVPVIIEGETGTGKEVLAESLHQVSPRASGPFVVFDCTSVPSNLLEAALFGHEKGAFTGAIEARPGVFEEADGGTLLIDEIGDLDIELQAKLLRALERSEVRRLGGRRWTKVDVRVLAATRRNLDLAIQEGRFRDDLFFRMAGARIELPPLRRRHGDVHLLVRHFWAQLAPRGVPVPPDFLERVEDYDWPGNVRELHNAVARRVALGDLAELQVLRPGSQMTPSGESGDYLEVVLDEGLPFPTARQKVQAEFERRYVERVLAQHGGNVTRAAAASGIALRYFQSVRARHRKPGAP
jgi:DNA-binding NtrC family response regulator